MTGVVPPLIADHGVGILGIDVNNLALPFIAPLGSYNNDIRHELFSDKWLIPTQNDKKGE
jgi:hypothetical protein